MESIHVTALFVSCLNPQGLPNPDRFFLIIAMIDENKR